MPSLTEDGINFNDGNPIRITYSFLAYINNTSRECNFSKSYNKIEDIESTSTLYRQALKDIFEYPFSFLENTYKYEGSNLRNNENNTFQLDPQIRNFKIEINNQLDQEYWWCKDNIHNDIILTNIFDLNLDKIKFKIKNISQKQYKNGNTTIKNININDLNLI